MWYKFCLFFFWNNVILLNIFCRPNFYWPLKFVRWNTAVLFWSALKWKPWLIIDINIDVLCICAELAALVFIIHFIIKQNKSPSKLLFLVPTSLHVHHSFFNRLRYNWKENKKVFWEFVCVWPSACTIKYKWLHCVKKKMSSHSCSNICIST